MSCKSILFSPVFPTHLHSLLELSLPKFSASSVTDVRDLLTYVDPQVEAALLGSQAEFSQLSNIKLFTIDKVTLVKFNNPGLCMCASLTSLYRHRRLIWFCLRCQRKEQNLRTTHRKQGSP